jgi:hypothetical protein
MMTPYGTSILASSRGTPMHIKLQEILVKMQNGWNYTLLEKKCSAVGVNLFFLEK